MLNPYMDAGIRLLRQINPLRVLRNRSPDDPLSSTKSFIFGVTLQKGDAHPGQHGDAAAGPLGAGAANA
jgi:hypothetical protein